MPICRNCGASFPNLVEIGGRVRNLQNRKFCLNCSPFGYKNTSSRPPILTSATHGYCNVCKQTLPRDHFYARSGRRQNLMTWCKNCCREVPRLRRRDLKILCIEYLDGKCVHCDYEGHPAPFDFHHTNPDNKTFGVSTYICEHRGKLEGIPQELKDELDKCELVCSNCHRIIHVKYEWPVPLAQIGRAPNC